MRTLLLYLLLLLAAGPAFAQPAQPVAPAGAAPAAPDTVAALHRLFAHKRGSRNALVVMSLGIGAASFGAATQAATIEGGAAPLLISVLAVPTALAGLVCYHQYSRAHEARALASFQARQLPARLRRQLKARYFEAPGVPGGAGPQLSPLQPTR